MDYERIRSELFEFVYRHDTLNHITKIRAMNYLMLDRYKIKIMKYISDKTPMKIIKLQFISDITEELS